MNLKNYLRWHNKKAILNASQNRPFFRVGEVWFCNLGLNIGSEQNGLRPVIIIKKFNPVKQCFALPRDKFNLIA